MPQNHLRTILNYAILPGLLLGGSPVALAAQDQAAAARRLAATAQLAAQEYRLGVKNGKVVAQEEVAEARLFLAEAHRNAVRLPAAFAREVGDALDQVDNLVARTADPDSVARRVSELVNRLATSLNIALDEIPADAPSLARGREVFQSTCAVCHGRSGQGDGPQAAVLVPKPANLADAPGLRDRSPLDFYRRITVGVAGTSMAPYEHVLSTEDRWAVAAYASVLRLPSPSGEVPAALRSFPSSARLSDAEVLAILGKDSSYGRLAAVRIQPTSPASAVVSAEVFNRVRRELDSAYALARAGRLEDARTAAMDAYVTFEQVERELKVKDPALTARIEAAFSSLRTRTAATATPEQLAGIRQELARALETAERTLVDRLSTSNLFVQSFIILVREGLEAILVIGALMAFLVKTGNGHRRRDIHLGVGAALLMSLLTAAALETIFVLSRSHQEGLEGGVMVLAAATLFYVSYWLLSKMEVAKWNRFVKGKVEHALTRGSALALASAAFLAVYREGFETVLFYKALAVSGGAGAWAPVLGGILVGGVVLGVVYVAINRFGVRLPLKPLFGVTGALLYYMAFVFAGKGIAELQESGAVSLTPLTWAPRIPAMGIYPTAESLAVQALLVGLAVIALVWIFLVEPARLRVTQVLVPKTSTDAVPGDAPPPHDKELLRSIDRIEADLAEVRSELTRMREKVKPEESESRKRP
jgi:high-affinity iron transporter